MAQQRTRGGGAAQVPAVQFRTREHVPMTNYLVFGAASAPPMPIFGRPHVPEGADDIRDPMLMFAVAPAGMQAAAQWLSALPADRWVFIVAQTAPEAQQLAQYSRARVMYAASLEAATAPGPAMNTEYGLMIGPTDLERAFDAACDEWEIRAKEIADRIAEQNARDLERVQAGNPFAN